LPASRLSSPPLLFLALAVGLDYTLVAGQSPLANQGPSEQAFCSGHLPLVIWSVGPCVTESPCPPTLIAIHILLFCRYLVLNTANSRQHHRAHER
jgi:hypothetical protein